MMTEPYVLFDHHDGIATITLNRPHSRNALSMAMLQALLHCLHDIAQNPSIQVVILKGAGPAFCAGHDLKEIRDNSFDRSYSDALFALCSDVMVSMTSLPQPIIAETHGVATAAGCQLVASADLAVATETTRFATPGVNIGLFCSTPMVALSRAVGRKHALQMLLTGEMIDAATALAWGLVNEIVPADSLAARCRTIAQTIASKSPLTLRIGKQAFYRQAELSLTDAYAYTSQVMSDNLQTLDAQEGICAFIDKRTACWRGQ